MNLSSILGLRIKRTGDLLRNSASDQIIDYNKRFESVKGFYDGLLKDLIVQRFDINIARDTAVRFFGSDKIRFVAIDGTEYPKAMYDFVIFFGGAYACEGEIFFQKDDLPSVQYDSDFLNQGFGLSSCVPIYVNKVPEIDQVFMDLSEPGQVNLRRPLTDEAIINNASIASWIMTFSEFYLAYRLACDASKNYKIILMDRSLSNMHSSLIYDTSRRRLWEKNSTIYGLEVDGKPIDMNDLAYGRHHIINTKLSTPPPRGDYLRYSIIYLLEREGPLSIDDIYKKLSILEEGRKKRVERYLKKSVEEGYLIKSDGLYRLDPRYNDAWNRLKKLVIMIGNQLFEQQTQNPMMIKKGGQLQWLTTQDLAFLTLFCFYMLIEECWKRKILLIGITKDTSAREFKNHVIPVCINNGIWRSKITQDDLDKVPNTDRMLLQSISLFNYQDIKVPWSLVEYDSAFMMIIPDFEKRIGYVSGAVKNKIILNRTFLRSYVQLSQAEFDPMLRSNVLAIDRLVYPEFDLVNGSQLSFLHEYGVALEPVDVLLFRNKEVKNEVQNLVMVMLSAMLSPSTPEAFGHNKPLYIADKVAKWHNEEFRRIVDSTSHWIISNKSLRRFVFYMSTFRERRTQFEQARRVE